MKGALGLSLAAGLGIVGALSNWFYLERLARNEEKVWFIAIKDGVTLNAGDTLKAEHLQRVGIPRSGVDYLNTVAPQWSALESVKGVNINRPMRGGEIVLLQDVSGPALSSLARTLQENEAVGWVPIDSGAVVPEHINPGDWVSFDVPKSSGTLPTPISSGSDEPIPAPPSRGGSGSSEIIGPFRVLSLGGRREPQEVWEGKRRTSGSENRIAILVRLEGGRYDPQADKLFKAIRLAGNQGVQVLLHSAKLEPPK